MVYRSDTVDSDGHQRLKSNESGHDGFPTGKTDRSVSGDRDLGTETKEVEVFETPRVPGSVANARRNRGSGGRQGSGGGGYREKGEK